jgi:hypothetical protein
MRARSASRASARKITDLGELTDGLTLLTFKKGREAAGMGREADSHRSAHRASKGGEMYDHEVATSGTATAERTPNASAGWYPVGDGTQQRYWDGTRWTEHFAPLTPVAPLAPTPPRSPYSPFTRREAATHATSRHTNGGAPPSGNGTPPPQRPWWKRPWVVITGGIVALLLVIGSLMPAEETKKETNEPTAPKTAAPAPPKPVELDVVAPDDGETIRGKTVVVRGRVSPADATVDVNGETVRARKGRFSQRVALDLGDNEISVFANRSGYEDASFTATVTRKRTAAEFAAIRERRRQRELEREQRRQERIAAMTQTFSGSGSKNIGTVEVEVDSILEWTNTGDPMFRQMLIYDEDFGISVTSDAPSGDTVVPAGSYPNVTVAGTDSWTVTIRPR